MKRVFIIHGYTGHPKKNWFPWLQSELENLGIVVSVPSMPNTNAPKLDEWLPNLQREIGTPDEETYLVGHSLGCPTILRYLESLEKSRVVGGALLVAGFAEPLPHLPQLDGFTDQSWDDDKICNSANEIAIINSDDDQAVPLFNGKNLRDRFNAELIVVHGLGHINDKSGVKEVPFVLAKLMQMMRI